MPSGSRENSHKAAARQTGVTYPEYVARRAAGEKWCWVGRHWQPLHMFGFDRSRSDGLEARCNPCRGRLPRRPPAITVAARRAHRRIYMRIRYGLLPHANAVPCSDCSHVWVEGERRHEYDHPRGYEGDAALDVECVCTLCHAARERARRAEAAVKGDWVEVRRREKVAA